MKKILFLVIDGLPDDKIPALGNKTPLEAARRINLDCFARNGLLAFFKPLFLGKLPDSEEVHFALFGYDPKKFLPGRGVLEAIGCGVKLLPKDIVLRGNLATIDKNGLVLDRRAGRIQSGEAKVLAESLNGLKIKGVKFLIKPVYGHRLAVILRGRGLSERISDTDEKFIKKTRPCLPLGKNNDKACFTARVVNEFLKTANPILENHPLNLKRQKQGKMPANFILLRGAGKLKNVESFQKKWGLKSGCLSLGALYRGIAKFLGMAIIKEKQGDPFSSAYLKNKFYAAKNALKKYDFVFCHVKGADLLAENGDFLGKKKFIEKVDKELKIFKDLKHTLLVITADHATSCQTKTHAKGPIPLLIWGLPKKHNPGAKFTESGCLKGNLGQVKNLKILPLVKNLTSEG
ncbi:MAG: 2,3-bisphosphoglycerate-independent phosphoglycerate mutase [bacterium]|nr:2,3-bisphosphoglycerate-independent phosphoglycerate mutase [bacterium]